MQPKLILLLLIAISFNSVAQNYPLTDSVKRNLANAKTPKEKIKWMAELSQFYMNLNRPYSDSLARAMHEEAELSRDLELIAQANLRDADRFFNVGVTQANLNTGTELVHKALEAAKGAKSEEYTGWCYMYLARAARVNGDNDKAISYNNQAIAIAASLKKDSFSISAYNALANTYMGRNEKLLAFRNYLTALNLAEEWDHYDPLKICYTRLMNFYSDLGEREKAKDYAQKIIDLTFRFNRRYDRLEGYSNYAKLFTASKQNDLAVKYYEKTIELADSLNFGIYRMNVYGMLIDHYFSTEQYQKGFDYFNSKKELWEFAKKTGMEYFINQAHGNVYTVMGKYDSAGYYYSLAEPEFEAKANKFNRFNFYANYARYYQKINNYPKAIEYLNKASVIAEDTRNIQLQELVAKYLDTMYSLTHNYEQAYVYNAKYHLYKDSLNQLAKEKDLMVLEVDNENKRKEREAKLEEERTIRSHNIQYLGITAAIAAVFVLLVMAGFFKVSVSVIRIIGFFAFIFLFEFIILLADNQIHHFTHGEPWKVFLIKIVLIAMLLPFHHWIEEKVIHYLTKHHMLKKTKRVSKFA